MTKAERQRRVLEILSARRFETISNIAHELDVSRHTVMRDLDELTDSASFYTTRGRYGSGVYATDGWYYSKIHLTSGQEALLREILPKLQPEQQNTMQSILDAFAKPTVSAG